MAGVALYSAVDDELTWFDLDTDAATLAPRGKLRLPAKVQYAWRHPEKPVLYVACSAGGPRVRSDLNCVLACRIGPDGGLAPFGPIRDLPVRAVHICVHPSGDYLLSAHNFQGGGLSLFRIEADGGLGEEIRQSGELDFGIYPHQMRVFPSGRTALIVDRGIDPREGNAERPGALRSYSFDEGHLGAGQVVAPDGGYGFGPRHVDFHPFSPWVYASDERRNRLMMFDCADDRLGDTPAYTRDLLQDPGNVRPRQLGGPIHVHPNGRFVYVANRADHAEKQGDQEVFAGGENSIAVFGIDPETGEPTLLQHAQTRSFHVRTCSIDPTGRLLIAASVKPMTVRAGEGTVSVPAALSVFRIGDEGRLDFHARYDIATGEGRLQYWSGIVPTA